MNKEYFLIGYRHRVTLKGYYVLDRVVTQSLREAEKDLKYRNDDFKKLIQKYDLIISEAKRWVE